MTGQSRRTRALASSRAGRSLPAWSIAVAVTLTLVACARPEGWVNTHPDLAVRARQDPQGVLEDAHARWDDLQGLAGSYQVRASRGVNSRTIDMQIYLLRDRFVEMQVLAPTGTSEGYLGAGTAEVGFWASDENTLYRGENVPGAFERALGIELTPAQIVAVLLGLGVPASGSVAPAATWDEEAQRVRVASARTTAWLHPVALRFERAVVETGSGPIEVEIEEWAAEGPPVPQRLTVRVASEDITLAVRLAPRWTANPRGLDPAHFDDIPVTGAAEAPLERLVVEGGLLRRGLGR